MISLDQVLLLEEKIESAVAKIQQLTAENAALRSKCAELTNALSAKTEQFSSFQTDQNKIEEGILKALERLNTVENAVHTAAQQTTKAAAAESTPVTEQPKQQEVVRHTVPQAQVQYNQQNQTQRPQQNGFSQQVSAPVSINTSAPVAPVQNQNISFDTAAPLPANNQGSSPINSDDPQQADSQSLFDIF